MAARRFFILLNVSMLFAGATVGVVGQDYTANWPYCSTTNNYSIASSYQVNLVQLMADLQAGAIDNSGFNQSTAGKPPDTVFGLIMCYVDRNWDECQNCLRAATAGVQQTCPYSREMKACYGACVLRYSNEFFFSIADLNVAFYLWIDAYVTDMVGMNTTRWTLMSRLTGEASDSPLRLANGSEVFTDSDGNSQVIYGLAQCTRDLNASECTRCLTYFVAELSRSRPNNTYGAVKGYSCYVVYQIGRDLGITLPPSPAEPPQPPSPPSTTPQPEATSPPHGPKAGLVAGVSVGSLLFVISLGILAWHFCRRRRKGMALEQELGDMFDGEPQEEEFEKGAGPKRFHYKDLAVATRYFSDEVKLGEGGFGSVYHGYLKDMDLHVAIKRVSRKSIQGRKEYESEVKIISRLRHRNLVELIGWYHGGDELLLVYELVPNGSLDSHIHSPNNILPWPIRHEIIVGIGSALLYLHLECQQCVLHRDIKPSNVMLDASFNPKLGDFGLARLVDHGKGSHTTVLAGTIGYMDPECMSTGSACVESDVYSFGVVVLEIACGRPPRMDVAKAGTNTHLVQWVWEFYGRGSVLDAADARLNGEFNAGEMERVMVTALWCAHPDRTQRPSIREAMSVLRLERPLPILPANMPVATFVPPPLDHFHCKSDTATGASSSTGTTTSSISTTETSCLLR
ncbi:L-type lectin-domain containing receptor kinase IX.1 [Dichanthelium oligosanthes]|uniref:L-type lectin-domain containing receptor kinase IX.1 n=1 Tax=Dichanthelium oligosanthes TaxID=888268 RepID=A0A1E5UV39_9POAL|nr:L-type lectin-domain containing receptor kinase IX.1 [Dichanthelium oligosanthes]